MTGRFATMTREQLERFACALAARPAVWQPHVRHDADERTYAQIWDADDVNAWVIRWSAPDHDTGFHDHDSSAAAIVVIAGQVLEERLRLSATPAATIVGPWQPVFVAPSAIHRVRHAGSTPAISIHAYSPPLRRAGTYTVAASGELERTAQPYENELRALAAERAQSA